MNKSFLCKALSKGSSAVAVLGVLMVAPMQAQADVLQFADLTGGVPGSFIALDKLNTILSPQTFTVTQNVGADHIFNAGDTFSETLHLVTNSSSLGANPVLFNLGGDYRIDANIVGTVTGSSGTPIMINPDNSVTSDTTSSVDVAFGAGSTFDLFNNSTNALIAHLVFQSGGAQNVHFIAGQLIGDVTINTLLGPGCVNCNPYIENASGGTIVGSSLFTITTGSERFLNFNGSDFATNTILANFQDNGQSTTFVPEPGSLALIGLGLLGLGATRRGKKSF